MKRLTIFQLLLITILIPAMCKSSLAHKIRVFAWQDGGKIVTESKFSKGRPAQNITISVVEMETNQNLLSGTTDTEGLFSFPIPKTDSKQLKIIADGGDGHKNSWNFTLEEPIVASNNVPPAPPPQQESKAKKQLPTQSTSEDTPEKTLQAITASELTLIIETTLDKKLAPIRRTLAEGSEKSPSLQDILGGIGYVLGLAGIAAYIQSLKNKKE
jgi:nickel transport protein